MSVKKCEIISKLNRLFQVLENAVAIGTKSLKLRGSVYSALSSALWSLGSIER